MTRRTFQHGMFAAAMFGTLVFGSARSAEAQRQVDPLFDDFNVKGEFSWLALSTEIRLDSEVLGQGTTLNIQHFEAEVDEYGYPIEELPLPEEWLDLGKDLTEMLIERGLTELEAGAFMRNWDALFFGLMGTDSYYIDPFYSNGAFVIYFMPQSDYNAQLALSANPPPEQIVRVGMIYEKIPVTGE